MAKSLSQIQTELTEGKKVKYKDVQKWVFDKLENSDLDSTEMEKEFISKFGKENLKHYEAAVTEYLGESTDNTDDTLNEGRGMDDHDVLDCLYDAHEALEKVTQILKKCSAGRKTIGDIEKAIGKQSEKISDLAEKMENMM